MTALIPANQAVDEALQIVTALPVFLAGSAVACAQNYHLVGQHAYNDVDIFCASQNSLIAACQRFISAGYTIDERYTRVWSRWLTHGFNKWHTNSLKLHKGDLEVNVIYKLNDQHPTTSLSQVLESFDFGLLAVGIDARDGLYRDLRPFHFPFDNVEGPLPFLPVRREDWLNGFISQYQGLREPGRYLKYHKYGYDMSAVKADMIQGYKVASAYHIERGDEWRMQLGSIYQTMAMHIEDDDFDAIEEADKVLQTGDDLDGMMEALQ